MIVRLAVELAQGEGPAQPVEVVASALAAELAHLSLWARADGAARDTYYTVTRVGVVEDGEG